MALTLILQAKLTGELFQLRVALNESACMDLNSPVPTLGVK